MVDTDAAYTAFRAAHEERLVRSLVSESGLTRTAAAAVVADVLPAAYGRRFASSGAAYGWLRVAARHRASGSDAWADSADAALVQARLAATALAGLPAADRDLLRLRYVEGVPAEALATRLGVPVATVLATLDRAVSAAAGSIPAPRRQHLDVPLPRVAAALALAAAAVFLKGGAPAPVADENWAWSPSPSYSVPVAGADPVDLVPEVAPVALDRPSVVAQRTPRAVTPVRPDPPVKPGDGCIGSCGNTGSLTNSLKVAVPAGLHDVVGDDELEVDQPVGNEYVALCDAFPSVPAGTMKCVRERSREG